VEAEGGRKNQTCDEEAGPFTIVMRASTCLALRIAIKTGPEVGHPVPDFSAKGLESRTQTLRSIMDPKGAEPVFFRSADWWAFCKLQLVELEQDLTSRKERMNRTTTGVALMLDKPPWMC
jgi:hypothetical protein